MWPMLASTVYLPPKNLEIVLAFAGDSTITSDLPPDGLELVLFAINPASISVSVPPICPVNLLLRSLAHGLAGQDATAVMLQKVARRRRHCCHTRPKRQRRPTDPIAARADWD